MRTADLFLYDFALQTGFCAKIVVRSDADAASVPARSLQTRAAAAPYIDNLDFKIEKMA